MRMLSFLAAAALLVATNASAQSVSDRGGARQPESAAVDRTAVKHHPEARKHSARLRGETVGEGSYADAPAARSRYERGRVAADAFDGPWSVLIMTRAGACQASFRYGVDIENGQVLNAGDAQVSLAGRVAPSGAVRVSVAAGGQEAHGSGRLTRTSGGGTWQGVGSAGTCAGVWQAERRE